jgi:hypothetical protein
MSDALIQAPSDQIRRLKHDKHYYGVNAHTTPRAVKRGNIA